jgi:hypothetical protein
VTHPPHDRRPLPGRVPHTPGERRHVHLWCRRCGGTALEVVAGLFRASGLRLTPYGYDLGAAAELRVDDEIVQCLDCGETTTILPFLR